MIKTTIAAILFGLSVNAFAAVSDLSNVTHSSKVGVTPQIGEMLQPRWSDLSAVTETGANEQVKPFAKSAANYRYGDISAVTHN